MYAQQDRSSVDRSLVTVGSIRGDTSSFHDRTQVSGHVSGGLPHPRSERTGGDNGSHTGQNQRDCGQHVRAELAEAGRHARILNVGARCRAHLFGESPFFFVIARHHGQLLRADSEPSCCTRSRAGPINALKERQD
jgi:hypothetical protein